jgi:hypothetical protein
VFREAGRLDDLAEGRLAPLAAYAGATQGLGQLSGLAYELLLLADKGFHESTELTRPRS